MERDVADAGDACAGRFSTAARAAGSACGSSPAQHQHVLLAGAAQADLDARAGQLARARRGSGSRSPACAAARGRCGASSDGQRRLARFGRAAGANGSPPACRRRWRCRRCFTCGHLHRPPARLLGDARASAASVRAGRQLEVDLRLRAVVRRDEAGRQQRDQRDRADEEQRRGSDASTTRWLQAPVRRSACSASSSRLVLAASFGRLEDVGGHHRREHARHHQRGEHRQRRGPAELLEELARRCRS